MKLRLRLNDIILVDILTLIVVIGVLLIPVNLLRIILSIPFLLFFPGHVLIKALFLQRTKIDWVEHLTLSSVLSVAISGLIGFILDYTPMGIRIEPIAFSVGAFIIITSVIVIIRRIRANLEESSFTKIQLNISSGGIVKFFKPSTLILILLVILAVGTLTYVIFMPKASEKYDEFYILGYDGKAESYPSEISVQKGQIVSVRYGTSIYDTSGKWGTVTLGIINRNKQAETYTIKLMIDGVALNSADNIKRISEISNIRISQDDKWEQQIAFSPLHIGQKQNLQFLLFKTGSVDPIRSLNLWIDVIDYAPNKITGN